MSTASGASAAPLPPIEYRQYRDERDLPMVMELIDNELSEPYSIFTYRYFISNWPKLCFTAHVEGACVGTIVCKLDSHRGVLRGYIAMLVVEKPYRYRRIGSTLVYKAVETMIEEGAEEVALEAEVTNKGALALYDGLGFVRDKRLHRYYLNGKDAFRLKLLLPQSEVDEEAKVPDLASDPFLTTNPLAPEEQQEQDRGERLRVTGDNGGAKIQELDSSEEAAAAADGVSEISAATKALALDAS
mmetsp:Transcript_3397/g.12270  ORF Transcript_3397/g.12270 Transcript_3397/m.12270 type:complete len:244 (+) Transcript_3397:70-801(+)